MKSREQVKELIMSLLLPSMEQRGINKEDVTEDQNLVEIGVLDSLSFLELLTNLEEQTQVEIDFDSMDPSEFTTINSLTNYFTKSNA